MSLTLNGNHKIFIMFIDNTHAMRYPKSLLTMVSVYSFTAASILTSIIFSLLLFLSIDESLLMKFLFGSLAVIFELGKFFAWYEYGERRAHKNYSGAVIALLFYLVLAIISIGGSIGGISSATNTAQKHVHAEQAQHANYTHQITALDKQIELNRQAAQKYIELGYISKGMARIQNENQRLRDKQLELMQARDTQPITAQASILSLIESLGVFLSISTPQAQLILVVFLSILLDFFAAFFVSLIGEEQRFQKYYHHVEASQARKKSENKQYLSSEQEQDKKYPSTLSPFFHPAVEALTQSQVNCSKRAIAQHFSLNAEETNTLFQQLLHQGLVKRKPNQHYQWVNQK